MIAEDDDRDEAASPFVGQDEQERTFLYAMASGRAPHAWLLAGPRGLGKAGFARRAASFITASTGDRAEQGASSLSIARENPAMRLIDAGSHPDFLWVQREAAKPKSASKAAETAAGEEVLTRNITIDQVRELIGKLRTRPAIARRRAIVIDSIDDLERGAANALLKTLEEPPEDSIFLLISHAPGRLLPTIRSRCRMLPFTPLPNAEMVAFIGRALPSASAEDAQWLVRVASGSPGRALTLSALGLAEIGATMEQILASGDADLSLRNHLVKMLSGAAAKPRYEAALSLAETVLARHALHRPPAEALPMLDARARVTDIARYAVSTSEDQAMVAMAIGSALAAAATEQMVAPRY